MKKRFISIVVLVLLISACTDDITRFNDETKRASEVPPGSLFSNAVKTLSDGLASASVNVNIFRHFVNHWAQAVIQEEAQFNYVTRSINDAWWTRMYRDVLNDLKESSRIITNDVTLNPIIKTNQLAIIDIMQVYTFNILVTTYGDIPYSKSLDDQLLFPVYDDAKTVNKELMIRLENDIAKLSISAPGFTSSEDIIFQGSVAKWISFANSLQVRMAMTISDVDNSLAKTAFEKANPNAINAISNNGFVKYFTAIPNNNPLYDQLVLANRTDYIAAKDLMDVLNSFEDPRKPGFFGVNNVGLYVGGIMGIPSDYPKMSKPSTRVADPSAPNVLIDYVEMEFYRAEAKERGYNVTGSAESHYNNAIKASILYWGGTEANADKYLLRSDVAYTTAAGGWKQKIGFQKWIALYNRPFEGWLEVRRLDFPKLTIPVNAFSGYPNRMKYPANEQQLNGTNYTNAATKIGGDKSETKLYWDIN
ncbi:SusD/RagB family nutrient-binding outer membrane lipoprotein [Flavobacterium sp. GSP27]|uniref:SusD/RagB family nutrient-binding outer membrane lipoprotein n=1 Tax=unclassified Flavobacterium TaxID=196869 RepID=UPI000F8472C1|nr:MULTISPECIES: SusD/RagB family nutrient-binding outer membrane lipoprotein [unclassified Flavobacterium]RTY81586.1 SusD/RagB family nutrient-binding outer membrane lipoprotein [Flavobacterium sp. ZB4P23]RTY91499.1 SusD/RagB family nutrient-binding outer membrane lipoprotein [Flavobacterium sp. RSP46]RTZ07549.1 SusD/RagB family nutrient-binding outer membrane lipoprotein [Flavobacterium sp. GSP6]RTZ09877.1 SusD/RagB family nutrient-binding outer membrane lipoprotein [Flavobacterium sp. GSP27]